MRSRCPHQPGLRSWWLRGRPSGALIVRRLLTLIAQRLNLFFKIGERLESPVNGGEAQVRDLVELPERPQDGQAHLVRGHLAATPGPDRLLDPLGQDGQLVFVDRAPLTGAAYAAHDLFPDKTLRPSPAPCHPPNDPTPYG